LSDEQKLSNSNNATTLGRIDDNLLVAIPHISKTASEIEVLGTHTQTISTVVESCESKLQKFVRIKLWHWLCLSKILTGGRPRGDSSRHTSEHLGFGFDSLSSKNPE
jgi:hypothetical protein